MLFHHLFKCFLLVSTNEKRWSKRLHSLLVNSGIGSLCRIEGEGHATDLSKFDSRGCWWLIYVDLLWKKWMDFSKKTTFFCEPMFLTTIGWWKVLKMDLWSIARAICLKWKWSDVAWAKRPSSRGYCDTEFSNAVSTCCKKCFENGRISNRWQSPPGCRWAVTSTAHPTWEADSPSPSLLCLLGHAVDAWYKFSHDSSFQTKQNRLTSGWKVCVLQLRHCWSASG